jgi:hypothetical protein
MDNRFLHRRPLNNPPNDTDDPSIGTPWGTIFCPQFIKLRFEGLRSFKNPCFMERGWVLLYSFQLQFS